MLIQAETKGKKEKISQLNHKMNKSFYKIDYKSIIGQLRSVNSELFNNINLNKYEAYMLINKVEDLSVYIPHIQKFNNYNQIIKFAQKYGRVILRPIDFYINAPVYFLEVIDNYIKITDNIKSQYEKIIIHCDSDLKELFRLNKVSLDNYFIQKGIRFIKKGELPYDIRLSMKREEGVHWKCSSLQFTIGESKILLNKISDKIEDIYLKHELKRSLPVGCKQDVLIKQIKVICQKACNVLEQNNPQLNEYEFDIAIDKEKRIWIIDINVLSSLKDFMQLDFKTYFSKKFAPILYKVSNNKIKY